MGENILDLIHYILYSIEIFLAIEGIFHNRIKEALRYVVVVILYLIILFPVILLCRKYVSFFELLLNVMASVFLFQGKLSTRLLHGCVAYVLINFIEIMVLGIGYLLLQQFIGNLGVDIVSQAGNLITNVITLGIVLILITRERIKLLFRYFQVLHWQQCAAILCIVQGSVMLVAMSSVMLMNMEQSVFGSLLQITGLLLLGAVGIGIIWYVSAVYHKEYYCKQNQLQEELIHTQQQYYQNMYEKDREMRRFRHDINSQLGCLHLLLSEGKVRQALEQLETVEYNYQKIAAYKYRTGNEILDVVINQKCLEAKQLGIDIVFEGNLNKKDFMNAYDLCTIFSNALQNGIDACTKVEKNDKRICISILEHGNSVFLRFANPATKKMYEAVMGNATTKADKRNHGFGVENIRMAAERNGGNVSYQYKDGVLTLEIFFES